MSINEYTVLMNVCFEHKLKLSLTNGFIQHIGKKRVSFAEFQELNNESAFRQTVPRKM